jgi:hypothetical protein
MAHQVSQFRSFVRSVARLGVVAGAIFAVAACSSAPADDGSVDNASKIVTGASAINLYVIDQGDDSPLRDAEVRLLGDKKVVLATAKTDAQGSFNLQFPSSGKYTLTVVRRGYSLGIAGLDTTVLTEGQKTVVSLQKLQQTDVADGDLTSMDSPGDANVDKELGRSVISSSGSGVTLFDLQGPLVNGDAVVPLYGTPGQAMQLMEMDAATLQPIGDKPVAVTPDSDGVILYTLSATAREKLAGTGLLLAVQDPTQISASSDGALSPTPGAPLSPQDKVVPLPGGGNVGVGTGFPDTCGPPGAKCVQVSLPTGNVQTFCPPATNAPYCSVSFSATIGATVAATPFGVGIDVTGSFTAGVGANVYANGTGTFQCNVKVTACAWRQPGTWVKKFGIFPCTNFLGLPDLCIGWRWVFVPGQCGGGGLQPPAQNVLPNLGLSNGFCTCFNWSVSMDKIKDCDGNPVPQPQPAPQPAVPVAKAVAVP